MGEAAKKLFLIIVLVACSLPAAAKALKAGDVPPDYVGRDTAGKKILLSEHRGKVIVLSFWATWCAPCRKELPVLDAMQTQVSNDRLFVVAINFREGKKAFYRIKRALKEASLTLSYDSHDKVSRRYGVKAIPHTVIIGKDGKIASIHIGYAEDGVDELVDELNALLIS